ncbi:MAG: sugar ABC transporter permease [Spirochaetaceae bacterium]|nr:sugar ABC transporter permease [Spirochaetaceae bacterium]
MQKKRINLLPYILISPTLFFVTMFTVWPTLLSVYQSLFKQRLNIAKYRTPSFVGLQNYASLLKNSDFIHVLQNTLIYVLGTVPLTVAAAFLLAVLLNNKFKGAGLFRLAIFHPSILPMVSAATIWMFFFTPDYGLFNSAISWLGYTGPQNWTTNPNLALISVMIVAFWKNAGYYMIFYLAGLQNLPTTVFEAARIDGAGSIKTMFAITIPLLRRSTLFITTIAFIGAFQAVDQIFVLTSGGPSEKSTVLLFYLWQQRFENLNVGKAAAITVILIIILLIFTISNFLLSEKKEGTDD